MAGNLKVIYFEDVEIVNVWSGEVTTPYISVLPEYGLPISWSNIHSDGYVTICIDRPFRIEEDNSNPDRLILIAHALPEKRCGNCKNPYEGGCNHCAGDNFGSFTEIVSWAKGCENWEGSDRA